MSPDGSAQAPLPEEKLLKLIRGKPRHPAASSPLAAASREIRHVLRASDGETAWWFHWPQWVGGLLVAILAIEVLVMVVQIIRPLPHVELPAVTATAPSAVDRTTAPSVEMPSLSEQPAQSIFATTAAEPQWAAASSSSTVSPSAQANALAARLSLVGIVAGDPPQAIIEDSQTQKTFFVTKGQRVIEGAVLQEIRDSHVILQYQGEQIELTL